MNRAKLIYTILEAVFVAVIPVVLVIYQYGYVEPTTAAFKISLTGIILLALVFYAVKRIFLDKRLKDWEAQYNNYISAYKIETDSEKKQRAKEQIQKYQTFTVLLRSFLPLLIFVMIQVLAKAVEQQMITLSSLSGLVTVSFGVGVIFSVMAAREV